MRIVFFLLSIFIRGRFFVSTFSLDEWSETYSQKDTSTWFSCPCHPSADHVFKCIFLGTNWSDLCHFKPGRRYHDLSYFKFLPLKYVFNDFLPRIFWFSDFFREQRVCFFLSLRSCNDKLRSSNVFLACWWNTVRLSDKLWFF